MLGKVTTGFQITIPAFFRNKANIKIGDYVDIQEENSQLIVTPISLNKRNQTLSRLKEILNTQVPNGEFENLSEDEILKIVNHEIKQSRKNAKSKNSN